ncbi:hypothetical protein SAMN04487857_10749 [Pseudomonas sp. ok272]|nr:hypothetical protein SAMN04487857_10749 [Pseudomonas sp. ok272]SFM95752.1 hypothetical protein SAMN04487858_109167 [Pseudomonas sp. ok602]
MRLITKIPSALAVSTSLLIATGSDAQAACVLTTSAGNSSYTCDSGTSGPLTDTTGNNTLTFPANGTGTINGDVTFGDGADRVQMDSGTLTGQLHMGNGTNTLLISAGQITGDVTQGDDVDTFVMTGGRIQSCPRAIATTVFSWRTVSSSRGLMMVTSRR